MTALQVLRLGKISRKDAFIAAPKHNLREIAAEIGTASDGHINPSLTAKNLVLYGPKSAAEVEQIAKSLLTEANIKKKLRKDAVRLLEVIVSLPIESAVNHHDFFEDAIQWAKQYFRVPLLSAVVHYDEAAPHMHLLLLPLLNGHMVGSQLHGYKQDLRAMHESFHMKVGQRHGLARQPLQKRYSAAAKREAANSIIDALKANSKLLNKQDVIHAMCSALAYNPEPVMAAIGLDMPAPKKPRGTFVGVMTKPC